MKLKYIVLSAGLSLFSILAFSSCDGSNTIEENSLLNNLDEVAESLSGTINNDRLDYTELEANLEFTTLENIIFFSLTGSQNKSDTSALYTYRKSGDHDFVLETNNNASSLLNASLSTVLGAPSPLGTRFRELILREEAVFTEAEVAELVSILNTSGASLFVDSVNSQQIQTSAQVVYNHRVTSNNRDFLAGTMRGNFFVSVNAFEVNFRSPTQGELNAFRLLTPDHKIPFVTTNQNAFDVVSRGVWTLSLANGGDRIQ